MGNEAMSGVCCGGEEGAGQLWPHPEMLLEPAGWGAVLGVLVAVTGPLRAGGMLSFSSAQGFPLSGCCFPCCASVSLGGWPAAPAHTWVWGQENVSLRGWCLSSSGPVMPLATGVSSLHHTPQLWEYPLLKSGAGGAETSLALSGAGWECGAVLGTAASS